MMEMVMFGVTLTVSMVVASLLVTYIAFKLMMNPKVWKKMYKMTFEAMTEMNDMFEEMEKDL